MTEKQFMLVSLEEAKAKKLASVLNNETSTKLLNALASKKHATESELSKELKIPLSTVHYNLKQLTEAKLVLADEYHYSEKGREVNHYRLANKYIIIAPQQEQEGFLEKLKSLLPVALIAGGIAIAAKLWLSLSSSVGAGVANSARMLEAAPSGEIGIAEAPMAMKTLGDKALAEGGRAAANTATKGLGAENMTQVTQHLPPADIIVEKVAWLSNETIVAFLVGVLFTVGIVALFLFLKSKYHYRKKI